MPTSGTNWSGTGIGGTSGGRWPTTGQRPDGCGKTSTTNSTGCSVIARRSSGGVLARQSKKAIRVGRLSAQAYVPPVVQVDPRQRARLGRLLLCHAHSQSLLVISS
ncbi:hypothetical protein ACI2K4_04460 [Micromonospora sp. NPDC050397]|uniref:hypothetical protein n=1 Tax=Micromonospora sp. NPDC050397 TaxID=3364279 RepID=UPI00384B9AF2